MQAGQGRDAYCDDSLVGRAPRSRQRWTHVPQVTCFSFAPFGDNLRPHTRLLTGTPTRSGWGGNHLRDEAPQLVQVNAGAEVAVLALVEVPHAHLTEVTRVAAAKRSHGQKNCVVRRTRSPFTTVALRVACTKPVCPCACVTSGAHMLRRDSSRPPSAACSDCVLWLAAKCASENFAALQNALQNARAPANARTPTDIPFSAGLPRVAQRGWGAPPLPPPRARAAAGGANRMLTICPS